MGIKHNIIVFRAINIYSLQGRTFSSSSCGSPSEKYHVLSFSGEEGETKTQPEKPKAKTSF